MTTNATILDVANLSVGYGAGDDLVTAVADVSFRLDRGHVLGIAGESGSGKSTLVYGLTRLLRAPGVLTGGSAIITRPDGTSLDLLQATEAQLRDVRWTQISVVMQSALNALNPLRKIGKEFHEVLKVHMPSMTKADRNARSIELLALVGLTPDRLARYPHELSGGQRQRVMIAMALALEPDLVIMDEPTTALDVVTQREIVAELHSLRERLGFAMLFITHDLSLLVELADDIMVMYAGRIVERAPALDLYNAPRHPHLGPHGLLPAAARRAGRDDRNSRHTSKPESTPEWLSLPASLRVGPQPLQRRNPTAPLDRWRSPVGRLLPP